MPPAYKPAHTQPTPDLARTMAVVVVNLQLGFVASRKGAFPALVETQGCVLLVG